VRVRKTPHDRAGGFAVADLRMRRRLLRACSPPNSPSSTSTPPARRNHDASACRRDSSLRQPTALEFSPDGRHLYVLGPYAVTDTLVF
jgi:hypothetical protein